MRERRWLLCFLVAMCCTLSTWALPSQDKTVTLNLRNVSVETALDAVKKQTGVNMLYNSQMFKGVSPVSVNAKNERWEVALKLILNPQGFDYVVKDGIVVIRKMQTEKRENRIRGMVVDANREPIPGASIIVKGTRTGTSTNIEGEFTLDVKNDKVTLEVSFIGMKKQTLQVDASRKKMLEITLVDDVKTLDDVVVTGYSNVRKTSFTGSSTQISGDDLRKVSQTNVIGALQTFDPSFRLVSNAQFGSDPNALPEMYIRGRSGFGVKELDKDQLSKSNLENNPNLPTFIMDGFEVSIEKIYDLDPTRIESMTILKDAAATAIYGSRAANGVVVITTVAPKPGEVRVSYNFTGTLEMPDLRDYNLANASEKLEIERRAGLYDKGNNGNNTTADGLNKYYEKYALIQSGIDTDWLSLPLRNAFDHKHSLYIEGGTPNLRYGVDASYNGGNGVMKGSGRDRYSIGFSLDYRVKKLQVKNTVSFGHTKSKESPYGAFSDYTSLLPYETPYKNGTLVKQLYYSRKGSNSVNNPLYEATLSNYEWSAYDEIIDNLSVNWYLNDYLTVKGQFSVTKQYTSSERFYDPLSSKVSVYGTTDTKLQGDLFTGEGSSLSWNSNAFLYYTRSFGNHNFNFSGGWEASAYNTENTSAQYRGFPSGQFNSLNYASEIYKKPTLTENTTRRVSILATLNYTWNDIYLADASVRFDGSSEFGANQKWAPFFSGGLGVNIHNYDFLKGNEKINKLKVRASYGRTGKVNFPAYAATTMYETLFDEWYITGYGAVLKALGNKDLSWEKTDKFNFGIETQFFNQRLTVDLDYYYEKTIDLINDVTLSQTSGFSTYKNNMGEVENKGFEMQIRADIYRDRNWSVALWGNMAHNKNKILKISDSQKAYNERVAEFYKKELQYQAIYNTSLKDANYAVPISQYAEGESLTSIWAVRSLGIDPTTGKELFLNRDGSITDTWDASQEVVVGNTEPKLNGSIGLNATYKNWSLFAAFQYEFGGQEYNQTLVDRVENADIANGNVDLRVLTQRWQKPGDVAEFKNIADSKLTTLPTSRFVQDKKYIRLSALTLSYDFNREWIKKHLHMNMLRLEMSSSDFINWNSIRQERGLSYPKSWKVDFSLKAQF
ncbi:SusC/RagA family TonB-linked outer membrane protein [Bacteroides finegoldii]|jgi:tonB-linked outer membrane protein, susC/ragA family|uniref:SusC/RagA family TonB-linked outer membrane protein n=3 Tax=Bacteroides finegoldii TaxID=338188 RepID=A0A7J4YIK7_9BACE|nr:SusC/RagA family TonB-linked outer membrane protein [Bacteroides finegoldii]KAA5213294.1 SusC/RagA family TonB-linked outer membrane protein [Bacteroides finegoldii]KAA5217341.1 SusC/RagA family TonB-linked outer membrane protein [Bacteroides finegoldii]KAA5222227.1 SusC/RagA family TonB-linked outer membrane protein [Bacteroides finegoldii]KAA5226391.1 SusC/RagA family TonB-linked outer membrane protein [Bacteroides finegoldii]KAA5231075.1 SusC/RagA family TonB-linked outer membrane protei